MDVSVFATDEPEDLAEFFNRERHGQPQIICDKKSLLARAAKAPKLENKIPKQDTPQKHDFGLRYIYRDFPSEEAVKLERFLRARELSTMQACAEEIYRELSINNY